MIGFESRACLGGFRLRVCAEQYKQIKTEQENRCSLKGERQHALVLSLCLLRGVFMLQPKELLLSGAESKFCLLKKYKMYAIIPVRTLSSQVIKTKIIRQNKKYDRERNYIV